mmetsp:Transcript_26061/g.56444  ORF Transcript_26061/g.56444 Transcript_26061/m.56444 type:complete len:124 (-) Transcript_26061:135-506(-)
MRGLLPTREVFEAKVVIMEATFLLLEKHTPEQAEERGHIHLAQIASEADKFRNEAVVLMHFSQAYARHQIAQAAATLPEALACRTLLALEAFGGTLQRVSELSEAEGQVGGAEVVEIPSATGC